MSKQFYSLSNQIDEEEEDNNDLTSTSSIGTLITARSSPIPSPSLLSSLNSISNYKDEPKNNNNNSSLSNNNEEEEGGEESYYPPIPLKSTIPSKELAYELDSDELDPLEGEEESLLLMEGLIQSSIRRGSIDLNRGSRRLANVDGVGGNEEGQEGEGEWRMKGAGVLAGIANMSNSILGAGIIGLPYSLKEAGFFTGLLLIVILGIVTDWTIRLIVLNSKMSGRHNYIDIVDSCFGRFGGRGLVSFFQFAFAFGGMCAFCVIIGDTIPPTLQSLFTPLYLSTSPILSTLLSRPFIITFLTLSVSYPLSLYRDIEKLSKASAFALVSMVIIVISVAVRGPGVELNLKGDENDRWTFIGKGVFEAIGVISFAFVCHHNSLLIYGSLRTPTLDRFARVTHISTFLSVVACLCMSTSGFLVFTSKTQGNILNNFSKDDTLISIARLCFGFNMFSTLPLEAFVCREVMETYFWPGKEFNFNRHVLITTGLVVSAMTVSLMTCDLGLILELAGGFSATALAYIFPAICYLKLTSNSIKEQKKTRFLAYLCASFGLSVMILSTFLSITKASKGGGRKTC